MKTKLWKVYDDNKKRNSWGLDGLKLAWNLSARHVVLEIDSAFAVQILKRILNNETILINVNFNFILTLNTWLRKN